MTPVQVEVLMHYYYKNDEPPNFDAPSTQDAIGHFLNIGCFEHDPDSTTNFELTDLGNAFVKAICRVPVPKIAYIDVDGDVL